MYKRMQLIPSADVHRPTLPPKSPYSRPLSSLDVSMREVLANTEIDDRDKALLYTQVLQRYLDVSDKYVNEPYKVMLSALTGSASPSQAASPQASPTGGTPAPPVRGAARPTGTRRKEVVSSSSDDTVVDRANWAGVEDEREKRFIPSLSGVPYKYRGRIERFLKEGSVNYTTKGQLIDDGGDVIPGSNVVKLVLARITDNKQLKDKMKRAPGMKIIKDRIKFKKNLRKSDKYELMRSLSPPPFDVLRADTTPRQDIDLIDFDHEGISPIGEGQIYESPESRGAEGGSPLRDDYYDDEYY